MQTTAQTFEGRRDAAVATITPERLAELEAGASPANYAECVAATRAEWARIRARIKAGESPFVVHRDRILQYHSTALRLQTVVLNLYNDGVWAKRAPVHLSSLLANADEEHVQVLMDLLRGYARNGENDREFLALGEQLARARLTRKRA